MLGELISTAGPNHINCCDSSEVHGKVQLEFTIE